MEWGTLWLRTIHIKIVSYIVRYEVTCYETNQPIVVNQMHIRHAIGCLAEGVRVRTIKHVMAAVKCRPVLHHCVVIFFWSSGIIDCMFVYI